jgi:hypothetical protein
MRVIPTQSQEVFGDRLELDEILDFNDWLTGGYDQHQQNFELNENAGLQLRI